MIWTCFHDMHSGGRQKLDWARIYIEQPEPEAKVVFFNRFGRNPEKVTCTCCGEDYSIESHESLAQLTAFDRGCRALKTPRVDGLYEKPDDPYFDAHYWLEDGEVPKAPYEADDTFKTWRSYQTLDAYLASDGVKVIRASEINPEECRGSIPKQGYVWVDE